MHYFSNLFWYRTLHVSDRFTVHNQESSTLWQIPIAVYKVLDSWWWTVNLSETCRVLYQDKVEKLLHLVGFVIRICHDARSSEYQTDLDEIRTSDVYRYVKEAYGASVLYDLWVWHISLNRADGEIFLFYWSSTQYKNTHKSGRKIQEQKAKWHLNFRWSFSKTTALIYRLVPQAC